MQEFEIKELLRSSGGDIIQSDENYCIMMDNTYFSPFFGYLSVHIDTHLTNYAKTGAAGIIAFMNSFVNSLNSNCAPGSDCLAATLRMMCGWGENVEIPLPKWASKEVIHTHVEKMCKMLEDHLLEKIRVKLDPTEMAHLNEIIEQTGSIFIPIY